MNLVLPGLVILTIAVALAMRKDRLSRKHQHSLRAPSANDEPNNEVQLSQDLEWADAYVLIDDAIKKWCLRHHLTLLVGYKDFAVRTVNLENDGAKPSIWIKPVEGDTVTIEARTPSGSLLQVTEAVSEVDAALERAYRLATSSSLG